MIKTSDFHGTNTLIILEGNTFQHRSAIGAFGARWSKIENGWVVRTGDIRNKQNFVAAVNGMAGVTARVEAR